MNNQNASSETSRQTPGKGEAAIVRQERASDIDGIREVVHAAFERPTEAKLVDGLRASGALVLSTVAVLREHVVGHLALSEVVVGEGGSALALAPIAVLPGQQRKGIGSAMIRWTLEFCRNKGAGVVIVLGEPGYYGRFGFTPASRFGIACPFPVPDEAFMALEIEPGAAHGVHGAVRYPAAFETV